MRVANVEGVGEVTYDELVPEHGDVAILLKRSGQSAVAVVRFGDTIRHMPVEVQVDYSQRDDDPPLTPRRVSVKAGWKVKEFEELRRV